MNTPQFTEDKILTSEIESRLHEIAKILDHHENKIQNIGIGSGSMGLIIFWTYYYLHFENENILKKISFLLGKHYNILKRQASISDFVYLRTATSRLTRREQELNECGWGYELLASLDVVEPEDVRKSIATTDRGLYRKMIDIMMSPSWDYLPDALMIGTYCVTKTDRIAKEFLRRFVSELDIQIHREHFNDLIGTIEPQLLQGLLSLLSKIEQKHTDIPLTPECRTKLYTIWIRSNAPLFDNPAYQLHKQDIWLLYAMTQEPRYKSDAVEILKLAEHRIRFLIETITLEAGMERGLVCFGHLFNRLYRQTRDSYFQTISRQCYQRLSRITAITGNCRWNTLSQGMFRVNFGVKNGLAGIGLALLAYVSDTNPQWDEYFYLS